MPFLVDSVTMEVNRQGLTLHLIVHPIIRVNRTDGTLMGVLPDESPAGARESFMHVEVDRLTDPARLEALAADLERVLDDVRVAVEDWKKMTRQGARDRRRPRPPPAAGRPDGARRGARVPRVARRRPLHLPRLPRPRPGDEGRRRRARRGARLRDGHPAREAGRGARDELLAAPAAGARLRAREGPADRHQVELALDRAPAGLPRLHRHQALRRPRRGGGRAPLPRALHAHGVPRAPERDPAPAAQGRERAGEGRPRARRPLVEVAREHPRQLSRATSSSRRPRTSSPTPRSASCISPSASASGSSSGATSSSASSPASSTRRARTSTPICARSGRRS